LGFSGKDGGYDLFWGVPPIATMFPMVFIFLFSFYIPLHEKKIKTIENIVAIDCTPQNKS
jgi:hypothetical protein